MHVALMTVIGLLVLAGFILVTRMLRRGRGADGARLFIWIWLFSALLNGAAGVFVVGIPLVNEIGAFAAIFGIPALAAWYAARRLESDA